MTKTILLFFVDLTYCEVVVKLSCIILRTTLFHVLIQKQFKTHAYFGVCIRYLKR